MIKYEATEKRGLHNALDGFRFGTMIMSWFLDTLVPEASDSRWEVDIHFDGREGIPRYYRDMRGMRMEEHLLPGGWLAVREEVRLATSWSE